MRNDIIFNNTTRRTIIVQSSNPSVNFEGWDIIEPPFECIVDVLMEGLFAESGSIALDEEFGLQFLQLELKIFQIVNDLLNILSGKIHFFYCPNCIALLLHHDLLLPHCIPRLFRLYYSSNPKISLDII
ncbi:hypothetical protein SUGI_0905810 [Cryptomeria japonica]|nr:hypothetical protein SUGI_0905810 [Cryptomeria japonica]